MAPADPAPGNGVSQPVPVEDRIGALFSALGGEGKIKVYRRSNGEDRYAGTVAIDADVIDRLEERIAEEFGSGQFSLKAYAAGRCVRSVQIVIDEGVGKKSAAAPAGAPAASSPAGPSTSDLVSLLSQAEERGRRQGLEMVSLMATMQERSEARWMEAIKLLRASPPSESPRPVADLGTVRAVADLLQGWGWSRPGDSGGDSEESPAGDPNVGFGERLLQAAMPAFGAKAGEVLAGLVAPAASSPAASLPAQAGPASGDPSSQGSKPRGPAAAPRGVSPDRLAELRRERAAKAGAEGEEKKPA